MANYEFNPELEDEDDVDSPKSGSQWSGRDATLFLIDTSPKMLQRDDSNDDSPLVKALKCAHATVSRKIIGNDQDLYAIIFFNTTQAKNPLDFPNIVAFQDLERPGAERMLALESILEDLTADNPINTYGSSNEASIHEVLWVCRNAFISSKKIINTKNVLLFTCEDNPHSKDEHKQRQAMKGAKDLKESAIEIEILPMKATFNPHKFYKELLTQGEDESDCLSVFANPTDRFDELLERVRVLEHKQRSTGRVSFSIAPGVQMGVKVFTFIRPIYRARVKLYKVTNEEVIAQRKEYLESNGELLLPSDFVKYQEYGGKKIKFTLDEVKSLPRLYQPGIELLGFKSMSYFGPYHYVKAANFIYPDELSVKGSCKLFSCLLKRCIAKKVCPVVRVIAREGATVSWAYLMPQEEIKGEGGCQEKPPGFYICYLPFADDFRSISLDNKPRANASQVDAAKDIMKKLEFKYHPDCFENPEIQTHWRNLEALALNRQHLEPVIDYTEPNHKKMEKKAGQLIETFKSLTLPPSYDAEQVAKKRPPPAPKGPAAKKAKPDPASATASVEDMAKRKQVDKLTVDVLKTWLQEKGVRVTGKKKSQLVQDVYEELDL